MLLVSVSIKHRTSFELLFLFNFAVVERKGFKQFTKAYNVVVPIHLSQVFSRDILTKYILYIEKGRV